MSDEPKRLAGVLRELSEELPEGFDRRYRDDLVDAARFLESLVSESESTAPVGGYTHAGGKPIYTRPTRTKP